MREKESAEVITLTKQYRQSCAAIELLALIQKQISDSPAKRVIINVENTTHIAGGLLLLLAVLPDFSEIYGKSIVIRHNYQNKKMAKVLSDSGVLDYYKRDGRNRADKNEIFNNAGTHGKNNLGTYTYGTLNETEFVFTIYDAGVGIRKNVNDFLGEDYSARHAMEWALTSGNSTLITDYPRGAGFSLLENFAYKNNGKITLCSDNIICIMEKGKRMGNAVNIESEIFTNVKKKSLRLIPMCFIGCFMISAATLMKCVSVSIRIQLQN